MKSFGELTWNFNASRLGWNDFSHAVIEEEKTTAQNVDQSESSILATKQVFKNV